MGRDLYGLAFPAVLFLHELCGLPVLPESQMGSLFFSYWSAQKEAWFSYSGFMIILLYL